ncbi:MAG TPA: hypothetical protein VJU13_06130 [Candidatus Nitrosocosmicus sp.]|nr:hypothetical protein [Candidatus Nitrosocosmicus sp.]
MLSVVFVGMMIFLVPSLIEEAQARIDAEAISLAGSFSSITGIMSLGKFLEHPSLDGVGTTIKWVTIPDKPFGWEHGKVIANVGNLGKVEFYFENPSDGRNTCDVEFTYALTGYCTITQGNSADATFIVARPPETNNNNFCDLLTKFGGEQTKIIKEKLPLLKCD